jgi:hypothetical protein
MGVGQIGMFYLVFIMLLFMASVMGHLLFCRKTTRRGLQAKAFIFIAVIAGVIYVLGAPLMASRLDPQSLWGLSFKFTAGVIFVLLVPVYLSFYVLTQLTSPSQKILSTIARLGRASYADILVSVQEEGFIVTRLNDLCVSGCVRQKEGRYSLSASGKQIALVLSFMQHMLGRDIGG